MTDSTNYGGFTGYNYNDDTPLKYRILDGRWVKKTIKKMDRFLEKVEFDSTDGKKELVFTFRMPGEKKDGERKNVARVDISDLVDIYTAGDGLSVTDKQFSAVRDEDSESYLTISESGIKLSGVGDAIEVALEEAKAYTDEQVEIEANERKEADEEYLTKAKTYTDEEILKLREDVNDQYTNLNSAYTYLNSAISSINSNITTIENRLNELS